MKDLSLRDHGIETPGSRQDPRMASISVWGETSSNEVGGACIRWTKACRPSLENAITFALGRNLRSANPISSPSFRPRPIRMTSGAIARSHSSSPSRVSSSTTSSKVLCPAIDILIISRNIGTTVTITIRITAANGLLKEGSFVSVNPLCHWALSTFLSRKDGGGSEILRSRMRAENADRLLRQRPEPEFSNGLAARAKRSLLGHGAAGSAFQANGERAFLPSPHLA
jgi:hypothetical protein